MINPLNKTGSLKRAKKSGKSAKSDTKCSKQENKLAIPDTNTLKQLTDDYCTDPNNYNTTYGYVQHLCIKYTTIVYCAWYLFLLNLLSYVKVIVVVTVV